MSKLMTVFYRFKRIYETCLKGKCNDPVRTLCSMKVPGTLGCLFTLWVVFNEITSNGTYCVLSH